MPIDPTTDPDFMKAAPSDQMKYLTSVDSDFAQASPQDQLGYLMHVRGLDPNISGAAKPSVDMQPSNIGIALAPHAGVANPQQPAEQFALENPDQQGKLLAASATGATGAATVAGAPAIAGVARTHPFITQMLAGTAISEARKIPYVGKFIPPYAEMLPMLLGAGKGKPGEVPAESIPEGAPPVEPGLPVPGGKVALPQGPAYGPGRINPPMEAAQSGTVDLHGYDAASRTLKVQFKNGRVYELSGVPQEIYDNYKNAESQGSFYQQQLKGRYDTEYVGSVGKTAGAQVRQALTSKRK